MKDRWFMDFNGGFFAGGCYPPTCHFNGKMMVKCGFTQAIYGKMLGMVDPIARN